MCGLSKAYRHQPQQCADVWPLAGSAAWRDRLGAEDAVEMS